MNDRLQQKQSLLDLKLKDAAFILIILSLMFQPFLAERVPFASYLDEGVVLLLGFAACVKFSTTKGCRLNKFDRNLILCLLGLIILGLVGNFVFKFNTNLFAIGVDMLTCTKFFVAFIFSIIIISESSDLLGALVKLFKLLVLVLFVLAVLNLFFDLGMRGEKRLGIYSFNFIFYHPVAVVWFTVAIIAVLLTDPRRNRFFILLGLLVVCFTLRAKGVGWAVAILILVTTLGSDGKLKPIHIIVLTAAIGLISYDSIQLYYFNDNLETARAALQRVSLEIANDSFPLGTGFGTFGSAITASQEFYSPLYFIYGLSNVWGLSIDYPSYISDAFWPTVIAQFGWLGLLIICGLVYFFSRSLLDRGKGLKAKYWIAPFSLLGYLILGSTAESAFFNPASIYFAIIIAVIIKCDPSEKVKRQRNENSVNTI